MSFELKLTDTGTSKIANAITSGVPIDITHVAWGDSDGALLTKASLALGNEILRRGIESENSLGGEITVEVSIPATIGGFYIRELGLFDTDGDMIAFANFPETYKPTLVEVGSVGMQFTLKLLVSDVDAITIQSPGKIYHKWLGWFSNFPTVDADGDTLSGGESFWHIALEKMYIYSSYSLSWFAPIDRVTSEADVVQTSNVDASAGPVSRTLPLSPVDGEVRRFNDYTYSAGANNITIQRNGNLINDVDADYVMRYDGASLTLQYVGLTGNWMIV